MGDELVSNNFTISKTHVEWDFITISVLQHNSQIFGQIFLKQYFTKAILSSRLKEVQYFVPLQIFLNKTKVIYVNNEETNSRNT